MPSEPDVLSEIKADANYLQTRGLKYLISRKDPRLSQDYFSKFFVFYTTYHPISSVSLNGLNMDKISFANISFIFSVSFADASLVGVSFWYSIFKSRGNSVQGFTQVNFSSADLQECDFWGAVLNIDNEAIICLKAKNIEKAYFDDLQTLQKVMSIKWYAPFKGALEETWPVTFVESFQENNCEEIPLCKILCLQP